MPSKKKITPQSLTKEQREILEQLVKAEMDKYELLFKESKKKPEEYKLLNNLLTVFTTVNHQI